MEIWPSFYSSASILTICYLLSFALCKSVCNCSSLLLCMQQQLLLHRFNP